MGSWLDAAYIATALVAVMMVVPVVMMKAGRTVGRPAWQKIYLVVLGALAASVLVVSTAGRAASFARSFVAREGVYGLCVPKLTIRVPW